MSFGAFSRVESGARFWPALFTCLLLAACGSDPDADDGAGGGGSDAGSGGTASGGDGSGGSASGGTPGTGGGSVEVEARAARITSGDEYNCAIEQSGSVFCWGTGSPSILNAPEGTFSQISAMADTSCGITTAGGIECWGIDVDVRSDIPDGEFTQVVVSDAAACALAASGLVQCWGLPEVDGGSGVAEGAPDTPRAWLARGLFRVCGSDTSGVLSCWGIANDPEPSNATALDASLRWCAIQNGAITCAGPSLAGLEPTGTNFVQVATGRYIACAIASDGHVSCWGTEAVAPPDDLFVEISAGERHACGITSAGIVRCWGAGGTPEATTPREIKVF